MRIFTTHPNSVGENYFQHMRMAFTFGGRLLAASTACFLHGLFPFLFERTGSEAIRLLHEEMIGKRRAHHEHAHPRDAQPQR